mmetsp:Transcript_62370/g.107075  ORF Transcript_62370/g.107075 Transcript_62370/m.107075 type:complete len:99 (+) Transcript_62370:263-559(+)
MRTDGGIRAPFATAPSPTLPSFLHRLMQQRRLTATIVRCRRTASRICLPHRHSNGSSGPLLKVFQVACCATRTDRSPTGENLATSLVITSSVAYEAKR